MVTRSAAVAGDVFVVDRAAGERTESVLCAGAGCCGGELDSDFRNEDSIRKVCYTDRVLDSGGSAKTEKGTPGQESGLRLLPTGASSGTEYWGGEGGVFHRNLYQAPYNLFLIPCK